MGLLNDYMEQQRRYEAAGSIGTGLLVDRPDLSLGKDGLLGQMQSAEAEYMKRVNDPLPYYRQNPEAQGILSVSPELDLLDMLTGGGKMAMAGAVKKAGGNAADYVKDLMFLHNTSAAKIARQEGMGGLPMPSIAVTKKDIPFDSFGDITLVGKPSNFDPKASKLNQAFSADAYTVRAPRPLRVAKKGAGKAFDAKYGAKLKELGIYGDEVQSNIWNLERKGDADIYKYDNVVEFFDSKGHELFFDEQGISATNKKGVDELRAKNNWSQDQVTEAFDVWKKDRVDEFFSPEEYFISNPNRDYYTTGAKLKPYNAEEATKFMKKSAGRNTEGGMASSSTGGVRASTTEQFTNLQRMKDTKGNIVSSDDMAEFKVTSDSMLYDLQDAFKSNYKYSASGWEYRNEFNDFLQMSETKGVKAAAAEVGFDPSKELIQELNEYKDMLRSGPTEYFESKPKRVVNFSEFSGAIVPKNTDKATIGLLESYGIKVKKYADEEGRLSARDKFKSQMFTNPAALAGAGLLGALGIGASDDSYASEDYKSLLGN